MGKVLFVLIAMALLGGEVFAIPAQGKVKLTLVKDGKPCASIVLGKQPTKAAQLAAFELQHHLFLITGATVPIVNDSGKIDGLPILVGESDASRTLGLKSADFKSQEYAIRFLPNVLVLIGRDKDDRGKISYNLQDPLKCAGLPSVWDEVGTLYAVYDFLERYAGVRWLTPTELGTVYTARRTLAVSGSELRRSPHFIYRQSCWYTDTAMYDALVSLWPDGSDGFTQYEAAAYPTLHKRYPNGSQYMLAKRNLLLLWLLRRREGGESHLCNHSLNGFYDRFWEQNSDPNLAQLFVRKEPSWFAQGYEGTPPQMCYTSRGLIAQLAQDAGDYYDGKKTGRDLGIFWNPVLPNPFAVEAMDNGSFCKCPNCQKWLNVPRSAGEPAYFPGTSQARSDYFFQFVNEVAKELAKTHPGKQISTLSYGRFCLQKSIWRRTSKCSSASPKIGCPMIRFIRLN